MAPCPAPRRHVAGTGLPSLGSGVEVVHPLGEGRGAYVYLIEGAATIDGEPVVTGDAAKVTDQPELRIRADAPSEPILVDVPLVFVPVGVWVGRP